jgi:hypothetical protein
MLRRQTPASIAVFVTLALPLAAQAQQSTCQTAEHRSFDFWEGSWEVQLPDGRIAGHNTIRRLMGGCVLHERYTTPGGYEGESLNIFDASRGVWHQTWTDNGGLLLTLEGGFESDRMILSGETVDTAGAVTKQRITWSRIDGDPDRVRQHWETSNDGGSSWTTAFDGVYVRRSESSEQ